ncbi:MAG: GNAT family N-acetyltransferase [Oceanicoccus sp.]
MNHLSQTVQIIEAQKSAALKANQRRLVVLSGEQNWSLSIVDNLLLQHQAKRPAWITPCAEADTIKINPLQSKRLLGQEIDLLVFDAWSGLEPNVFAAVTGSLVGGGLLVLLTPPLDSWRSYADPDYQRMLTFPFLAEHIEGRFLAYITQSLQRAENALVIEQDKPLPAAPKPEQGFAQLLATADHCLTRDQSLAVAAIVRVSTGHAKRPLVITSDRGRGKSSALGIACAQLMAAGSKTLVVTAFRREAVRPVFEHAKKLLGEKAIFSGNDNSKITFGHSSLQFVAADELRRNYFDVDLLLVDEAAAIPAAVLEDFLTSYSRIVYATTVHGYEGSGRGFDIRFKSTLDSIRPQWKSLNLQQPIRWQQHDPVEDWLFDAMLLKAAAIDSEHVRGCEAELCVIEKIDKDELLNDRSSLTQLFGLLVMAHYQTSPNDLRALLDAPNIIVWVSRYKGSVVAAALVSLEGGFSGDILTSIWEGKRRPRGHLLPQTLSAHEGLKSAPALSYRRIMRIAVHPAAQRKQLGSHLVAAIVDNARSEQCDFVGSSFAATTDVLKFWRSLHCIPVRMGVRRDASSGCYSAIVLSALSTESDRLLSSARQRFNQQFSWHLSRRYCHLEPKLVVELLIDSGGDFADLSQQDWQEVAAFVKGFRQYDMCCYALWGVIRLALSKKIDAELLTRQQIDMLVMKVLQGLDDEFVIGRLNYVGKKQLEIELRAAVTVVYRELCSEGYSINE